MSEFHKCRIRLTDGQKRKLRTAFRARKNATIGLRREQIDSKTGDQIILNQRQYSALTKALKANRGLRLVLSFEQLTRNANGGLLKEVLEKIESVVPFGKSILTPLVKRKLAPMLKDRFLPWLKGLIDNELDTIIERDPKGSGLKLRINKKLDSILTRALKKRKSNRCRSAK